MTTNTNTRTTVQVEAVATAIVQNFDARDYADPASYAYQVNNELDGWTIDVNYGGEGSGNWTRTEGLRLSDENLARAVALAESWGA